MTSVMLYMLQIKGLFGGQVHKDPNQYLKNFVEVYAPFDIPYITKDSIRLRLFPFSLMGEAVLWLRTLPTGLSHLRSSLQMPFWVNISHLQISIRVRFNVKFMQWLNHEVAENFILQIFYRELDQLNKTMVDNVVGGSFVWL